MMNNFSGRQTIDPPMAGLAPSWPEAQPYRAIAGWHLSLFNPVAPVYFFHIHKKLFVQQANFFDYRVAHHQASPQGKINFKGLRKFAFVKAAGIAPVEARTSQPPVERVEVEEDLPQTRKDKGAFLESLVGV